MLVDGFRATLRVVALAATTLGLYLLLRAGLLARRRAESRAGWQNRLFRAWCRALARLLGVEARWHGAVPDPPFVLVANHLSYVDILLLGSRLPCLFVAKAEVAEWPVLGHLCRSVGTLFIDRDRKRDVPRTLEAIRETLGRGLGVVFFPEGTSSDGARVPPFRPALLELPARLGMPVHHAALAYRTPAGSPPAGESVCWWGDAPFLPHLLRLLRLPAIEATVVLGSGPIAARDRKALASDLHAAVSAALATA